jgi:hypothetical protein
VTATKCWCPSCEPGNHAEQANERRVRDFAQYDGDYFTESIGLLFGQRAAKSVRAALDKIATPTLTKAGPVATHFYADEAAFKAARPKVTKRKKAEKRKKLYKRTFAPGYSPDELAVLLARAESGDRSAMTEWDTFCHAEPGLAGSVVKHVNAVGVEALVTGKTIDVPRSVRAGRMVVKSHPGPSVDPDVAYYAASGNRAALALLLGGTS